MSEILTIANELVAAETARLQFYESCIVAHMLDQLSERALQMIEKRMPQTEITKVADQIGLWTDFGRGSDESLANLGTGPDEEEDWVTYRDERKKELEEKIRRAQDKYRSNNLEDGYQL